MSSTNKQTETVTATRIILDKLLISHHTNRPIEHYRTMQKIAKLLKKKKEIYNNQLAYLFTFEELQSLKDYSLNTSYDERNLRSRTSKLPRPRKAK